MSETTSIYIYIYLKIYIISYNVYRINVLIFSFLLCLCIRESFADINFLEIYSPISIRVVRRHHIFRSFFYLLCRIIPRVPYHGCSTTKMVETNAKNFMIPRYVVINYTTCLNIIKFHPVVWLLSWLKTLVCTPCGMIIQLTLFSYEKFPDQEKKYWKVKKLHLQLLAPMEIILRLF